MERRGFISTLAGLALLPALPVRSSAPTIEEFNGFLAEGFAAMKVAPPYPKMWYIPANSPLLAFIRKLKQKERRDWLAGIGPCPLEPRRFEWFNG